MPEGTPRQRAGARSSWITGLVFGALGGFALFVFPVLGLAVLGGGGLLIVVKGRVLAGGAGAIVGLGGLWLALFGRVRLTCQSAEGCFSPGLDGPLSVSAVALAVGIVLTLVGARNRAG